MKEFLLLLKIYFIGVCGTVIFFMIFFYFNNYKGIKYERSRYFFISYNISNKNTTNVGNFYHISKNFPTNNELRITALSIITSKNHNIDQCIITGIYEFKDSLEMNNFKNN